MKNTLYYERMQAAAGDKCRILEHILPNSRILDVGAGGGTVSELIAQKFPDAKITLLEADAEACGRLRASGKFSFEEGEQAQYRLEENDFFLFAEKASEKKLEYDVIVFSAVIHEIYSYTEYGGRRYNPLILPHILATAESILKPGGRIIIRDGVLPEKTEDNRWLTVTFHTDTPRGRALEHLAARYMTAAGKCIKSDESRPHTLCGACDDITNMLYTITWGEKSFEREVQEKTAYFRLSDWAHMERLLLRPAGLHFTEMCSYLQPGYAEHLLPYLSVTSDGTAGDKAFPQGLPDSNCLLVLEKE